MHRFGKCANPLHSIPTPVYAHESGKSTILFHCFPTSRGRSPQGGVGPPTPSPRMPGSSILPTREAVGV
eukprot:301131-Chlamydomonas_euryale.AAC.1